ncbi:hypothetical protein Taro_049408 [Colocasia esculenta]|uniref:Uncharacterized protein n=1 Tax=Colocasia esculenta TaxID=4460 RepID=A0A843XAW1_COLES|nr:hypothetical protein [Colocasia esculenta]
MENSETAPETVAAAAAGFSDREASSNDGGEIQPVSHPRRPLNLSTLQIPARTLESPLPTSTRISIPFVPTPTSTRAALPPRPHSTKAKPTARNLLPQRSLRTKNQLVEWEKTGLLTSGASPPKELQERASTSRTFSFARVFSSASTKRTNSLPVTPIAGPMSEEDGHVVDLSSWHVGPNSCGNTVTYRYTVVVSASTPASCGFIRAPVGVNEPQMNRACRDDHNDANGTSNRAQTGSPRRRCDKERSAPSCTVADRLQWRPGPNRLGSVRCPLPFIPLPVLRREETVEGGERKGRGRGRLRAVAAGAGGAGEGGRNSGAHGACRRRQ